MNHPAYTYLDILEEQRSEDVANALDFKLEDEDYRAFGSYDARIGRYPQSAAIAYLEAYCPDDGETVWLILPDEDDFAHKFLFDANFPGYSFRKPEPGMAAPAKMSGWDLTKYVGDLSGNPDYAEGRDSDRAFAINAGLEYQDIQEFLGLRADS